jgi:hypothetical protein
MDDLQKLNVRTKATLPYLITADHLPSAPGSTTVDGPALQMDLFAPVSALTGVL